jgi:lipopolysaccharide biosynthesis glycosyltransferase
MQGEYERILYLDADIFFHGGDLSALLNIDMSNLAVAAVRDSCQWIKPDKQTAVFKSLGIGPKKYLNSGVMLFDVANYVAQDILAKCLHYGRTIQYAQRQHDQELINGVLQGNWAELSPIWNWQHPIRSAYFEVMLPVAITHFIGPDKPWRDPYGLVPPRYTLAFATFLRHYFPDLPHIAIPRGSEVSSAYVRKLTLKNVFRSRPLKRYLKRFPTDLLAIEP